MQNEDKTILEAEEQQRLPMTLRSVESQLRYETVKATGAMKPLDAEPSIRDFKLWRIIQNNFPYDGILKTHHLLLPKRKVGTRFDLDQAEREELEEILQTIEEDYDFFIENFPKRRSVPGHYHLHLCEYHDRRDQINLH